MFVEEKYDVDVESLKSNMLNKASVVLIESGACVMSLLQRFDTNFMLQPKDTTEIERLWQAAFYCTGTADNLTATSSPFQGVIRMGPQSSSSVRAATKVSGWDDDVRRKAWQRLCAPTLLRFLDQRSYMFSGEKTISAIDIFVGMPLFWLDEKKGWLADVPDLESYYRSHISASPAFREAIGDAPGGFE